MRKKAETRIVKERKAGEAAASPQLVAEQLDRIEAANGALRAFVSVLRESALDEARLAEAKARAGAGHGLVHGLGIAVKDIIDVAGEVSGCGSLTRRGAPPARRDAPAVARLRSEGAIVLGKTHTVEFAFGGYGTNVTVGTPWNPWDRRIHRVPGGSSSGSGVAVGAGLVKGAFGTDTGGSVRIPAALCGCVGLKTSIGLVGRSGVAPLSQALDTVGPIAADVRTAALMLAAMQGHDPEDPSTDGVKPIDALTDLERGIAGLRIGRLRDADIAHCTAEVRADFKRAVRRLEDRGARVEEIALPHPLADYTRRCGLMIAAEAYANYKALVDDEASGLAEPIRTRMAAARQIIASDHIALLWERRRHIAGFLAAIDRLDAVVLPTLPMPAIPVAEVDESVTPLGQNTRWVNYLELAGLAVPTSLSADKLPLSLQIVVRRFDDALALRIGRAFEAARGTFPLPPE